ncbi:MAG: FAD binding domain-containing protein, partial [Halobacteriota archaeon]
QEAVELLADLEDAEVLAGNQSLGIVMANRLATPDHLVDLNGIEELFGIEVADGSVSIGAMTRHRTIERSEALAGRVAMLPEAAEQIAGPTVRNRGTIGGSLAEADPAGNYPTALTALEGTLHIVSADGRRTVDASSFFLAYMFTDLREDELIERVTIDTDPFPPSRTGMAFLELKRAAQTWPTVSAAAAVRVDDPDRDDPLVEDVRLALANVADVPLRVTDAESSLEGEPLSEAGLDAAAETVRDATDPEGELHANRDFKRDVAGTYARRAVETAHERALSVAQTRGEHRA